MQAGQITDLAARIRAVQARPIVVAIDGPSGVGKSTLAGRLAVDLDAALIEGDDFYAGGVDLRSDPPEVLARDCIDWQAQRAVLEALKAGREARYYPFDWQGFDGNRSATAKLIAARPVIILEGVYAARTELRDLIDLSVLITLDQGDRMRRMVAREGELTDWDLQWHRAEDWYFTLLSAAATFDLVIGG